MAEIDPRLQPLQAHRASRIRDIEERESRMPLLNKAEQKDNQKVIDRKKREVAELEANIKKMERHLAKSKAKPVGEAAAPGSTQEAN